MPTGCSQLLSMRAHLGDIKNAVSPFVLGSVDVTCTHARQDRIISSVSVIFLPRILL